VHHDTIKYINKIFDQYRSWGRGLQSRIFSLEGLIIRFVMTYTATCFDYKLVIYRWLKLSF